jgi:hypothetical protein
MLRVPPEIRRLEKSSDPVVGRGVGRPYLAQTGGHDAGCMRAFLSRTRASAGERVPFAGNDFGANGPFSRPNVAHLTPSLGGSVAKSGAFHLGGYPLNSAPKRRAGSIQWPKPKSQSASIWTQEAELVQERSLFWRRSAKPGPLRQPRDQ